MVSITQQRERRIRRCYEVLDRLQPHLFRTLHLKDCPELSRLHRLDRMLAARWQIDNGVICDSVPRDASSLEIERFLYEGQFEWARQLLNETENKCKEAAGLGTANQQEASFREAEMKAEEPIPLTDNFARALMEYDRGRWRNKAKFHMYVPLIVKAHDAGIDIPAIYFDDPGDSFGYKTLSDQGAAWVIRQLRIHRRTQVKEWVAILGPVVSVVISVAALVVSLWRVK